jgi:hypothetical protein
MQHSVAISTNGEDKAIFRNVKNKCPRVFRKFTAAHASNLSYIHATRVKVFLKDDEQKKQVPHLLELIENSNKVVNHTAPNSLYSRVMADLLEKIDSWRTQP